MGVAIGRNAAAADSPNPPVGALEYGFWAFLIIAIGRVGELIPGLKTLPIVKITLGLTLLILIAKWKKLPALSPAARPLAKTSWWILGLAIVLTPLSYWRGASLAFLQQELPVIVVATVMAYMMCRTWQGLRGAMIALIVSGLALTRAALSGYNGGRAAADTMYDTNDLAYLLVTIAPLALGFGLTATRKIWKFAYLGAAGAFVIVILLTSSRGGFLGLVAVVTLLVLLPINPPSPVPKKRMSRKTKGKLILPLIVALGGFMVVWPYLPQDTRDRIASIVSLQDDYNLDATNEKSRGRIWRRGVIAAVQRPYGYGPRSFGMVDLQFGGKMMAPHNSFVQSGVELGILGLIMFLRMYWLSWRGLGRARSEVVRKPELDDEQRQQVIFSRMLQIGLVGNAVAGFFLTMAYSTVVWVMFGITMGVLARMRANEAETAPAGARGLARVSARPRAKR